MNSHKSARLTALGRAELVHRVVDPGQLARQVAAALGVCVKTVRKWVGQFEAEGVAGLCDRTLAPAQALPPDAGRGGGSDRSAAPGALDGKEHRRRAGRFAHHAGTQAGVGPLPSI
jgi:hypothetical protein